MSRDRVESGDGSNLYKYAQSSPENLTDPTGYATYQRDVWLNLAPRTAQVFLGPFMELTIAATPTKNQQEVKDVLDRAADALDKPLTSLPGKIDTTMVSGREAWNSDDPRSCTECAAPEIIEERKLRSGPSGANFGFNGSAGFTAATFGANSGGGLSGDVTISIATGSIEIYADGWSLV